MKKEKTLEVATLSGQNYKFSPVPMKIMPSSQNEVWLKFQRMHVNSTLLSEDVQNEIQRFMKRNGTEALTDGVEFYTLAGGMLAYCNPKAADEFALQKRS